MYLENKRENLNKNFNGKGNINYWLYKGENFKKNTNDLTTRYNNQFSNKEIKLKKQLKSNEFKIYDYNSQVTCLPIKNKRIEFDKYDKFKSNRTDKILMDYYVFKDDLALPGQCHRYTNKNIKDHNPKIIELNRLRLTNEEILKYKKCNPHMRTGPKKTYKTFLNIEINYKKPDSRHLINSEYTHKPGRKIHDRKINLYKSNFKIE